MEHQSADGRKFYYNADLNTSVWEKPEEMMSSEEKKNTTNWREYRIWDGRVYYHNKETKVSCWVMPPELRRLRGEPSGLDDRPMLQTLAEKREAFMELMKEQGVNETWTWSGLMEALGQEPQALNLSEAVKKQCFAELMAHTARSGQVEERDRQRNAAKALEGLLEERFSKLEDLDTTYEQAKELFRGEDAWELFKSDVRREEVFQNVMDRLDERLNKTWDEKRGERLARLQRLIASDAELCKPRLEWDDALQILKRREELQEGDPPLEALRVWAALRRLKPASEHEAAAKAAQNEPDLKVQRRKRPREEADES